VSEQSIGHVGGGYRGVWTHLFCHTEQTSLPYHVGVIIILRMTVASTGAIRTTYYWSSTTPSLYQTGSNGLLL